jgi:excisionase family DNA binding protein
MDRLAYCPKAAAAILSVSRAHLYRLLKRGDIRAVKCGRSTRFLAAELERFIAQLPPARAHGEQKKKSGGGK